MVVASIDSGVDYTHSDLAANIWVNPGEIPGNGVDDDGNGYIDDVHGWDFENNDNDPMDDNGHGTHTAGTIAGVGNNGLGITGVAWRAAVMPLKFMDSTGSGFSSNAAAALIYAANAGAQISNNSWGCFGRAACFSQTLENAIAYANTLGMTFVTSAGNDGANVDVTVDYPCTSTQPNVVCVAATDQNDLRPAFSSYGATSVDLGAPGVNILSTVPSGSCELCDSSGYLALNGTSMAGPHVAGAAAVLISRFPGYTHTQIINLILGWVDPVASLAGLTVTGGRLNLNAAVQSSLTTSPDFEISVSPTSQAVNQGDSTTYLVTGTSLNGYAGTVTLNMTTPDTNILGLF
ncbi:MAG TPA: S8 family peptidase, partial [Nitrospiria bacterium]|nr:S8 family peptidase [Nitrospiria bacterium]